MVIQLLCDGDIIGHSIKCTLLRLVLLLTIFCFIISVSHNNIDNCHPIINW